MVNTQITGKRVVVVGLNRRGNHVSQKLSKIMSSGKLGKLTVGRATHINNMYPDGIGKLSAEAPPKDFNFDNIKLAVGSEL